MRFPLGQLSISVALALAACGGAVEQNPFGTSGGGAGGTRNAETSTSGTGTGTNTTGDTSSSSTSPSSSSTVITTTGTSGVGGSGPGTTGTSSVTTGSNMTSGTCGSGIAGSGGAGGTGGAGSIDAGLADRTNGFVLRYGDFPPFVIQTGTTGTSGTTTTTGGTTIDPDTQFITLGTEPSSCTHPHVSGACGYWQVSIAVPPALFKPGVISLACGGLNAYFSVTGPDRGGGDCSGGGGSFYQGTIDILYVDATSVRFRLTNTQNFDFNADGLYSLPRCR